MGCTHGAERLVGRGDVVLRSWTVDGAEWYAATVTGDPLIQRFTSESPTVTVDEMRAAIVSYWIAADARGRGADFGR